ncbi:helix-turn-helix domain-containing protein [Paenibacillus montanisoli]|nr:helix-turn-helix domain-containing protein [Paenibacillus montanisoli]
MKRNGYRKLLFSYVPILIFVVSVLFLVFFGTIYELTRKQTVKANDMFAQHVLQNLNYNLRMIDQLMIKEILTNEKFSAFFDPSHKDDTYLSYQVNEKLKDFIGTVPMVHSVYLYRTYDHKVLSSNIFIPLDSYGDREFIRHAASGAKSAYPWTDPRPFNEFKNEQSRRVVSLVKRVPLLSGSQGLIVVNVATDTLEKLFKEMSQSDISLLYLADSQDQWIRGDMSVAAQLGTKPWKELRESSVAMSELSGWRVHVGIKDSGVLGMFRALSYSWIVLGLIGIIIGAMWLVRTSRNHYRPLEAVLSRVQQFTHKSDWNGKEDEYRYIGSAIDRLLERSSLLEKQAKESSIYRTRILFTEVMEGLRLLTDQDWQREAASLGWPETKGRMTVALLEIDKLKGFQEKYSSKDQYLLKFVLQDVLKEMAQEQGLHVWAEWLTNTELGVLISVGDNGEETINNWLETLRQWVDANLEFTVTIGLGGTIRDITDLSLCRDEAAQALRYKTTLGMNRIIVYADLHQRMEHRVYEQHQVIKQLAEQYRLMNAAWQDQLKKLDMHLNGELFERSEIVDIIHFLLYQFGREMQELSTEYRDIWRQDAQTEITALLDRFETVDELINELEEILSRIYRRIESVRSQRNVFSIVQEVKSYVERNYADPSLSLVQLSDQYEIGATQLSRLFKEEVGEKLVDYLTKVRMEQAKRLLLETKKPVQDIALDVGYTHSFSFIRSFKKYVGRTPGEYRKE